MLPRIDRAAALVAGAIVALCAVHLFLARGAIRQLAATYDEPVHLTAGYVDLKTADYRMNGLHHPPFGEMWPALGLLRLNPIIPKQHEAWVRQEWGALDQYRFADTFLYHNRVAGDDMVAAGRWMQALLSVFLGLLVAGVTWSIAGPVASVFAAAFWAFSPAILANGTVISTDLAFTVFFFCFFASLAWFGTTAGALCAGMALGLCFASKFFAVALGPIAIGLFLLGRWKKQFAIKLGPKSVVLCVIGAAFALAAMYQFSGLDVFREGFARFFGRSQAGRSSFFLGEHGTQGWLLYFPFAFLVKTPIALLLSLALALVLTLRKKLAVPMNMWLPPILFLGIACLSKVQIGHRYILSIYPFLFVIAGLACASATPWRITGLLLTAWMAVATWAVRPHFLAYFNEIIGGPSQGYKYLTDSNVDWGQGLKPLAAALEPDDLKNGIYLSYFGVVDPHEYGIVYKDVGSDRIAGHVDDSARTDLKPTKLAVSVTNLQGTYYGNPDVFAWVKAIPPWKVIGYSIFVYDFKNNPEALARLEKLRS